MTPRHQGFGCVYEIPKATLVSEEAVARTAFRKHESAIAVVLPEGSWQVEIANEAANMVWHSLVGRLIVQTLGTPLIRTLQLPRGGWTAEESSPRAYNRAASLEELGGISIEYSEEAFLERVRKSNITAVELFLSARLLTRGTERDTRL